MSTYLTLPCRGHLEQIFHVCGYPKVYPKRKLYSDPQHEEIDERFFAAHDWYDLYQDVKETLPADAPTPRGDVVSTHFLWTRTKLVTGLLEVPRLGS